MDVDELTFGFALDGWNPDDDVIGHDWHLGGAGAFGAPPVDNVGIPPVVTDADVRVVRTGCFVPGEPEVDEHRNVFFPGRSLQLTVTAMGTDLAAVEELLQTVDPCFYVHFHGLQFPGQAAPFADNVVTMPLLCMLLCDTNMHPPGEIRDARVTINERIYMDMCARLKDRPGLLALIRREMLFIAVCHRLPRCRVLQHARQHTMSSERLFVTETSERMEYIRYKANLPWQTDGARQCVDRMPTEPLWDPTKAILEDADGEYTTVARFDSLCPEMN